VVNEGVVANMLRHFILLLAAGCGACQSGDIDPDLASAGAEFRWYARMAYEVRDDPCDFAPAVARAGVLAPERRAMADLESRLSGTPPKLLMDVARADVAYARGLRSDRRCDTALASPAETRIGFARRDMNAALERMHALAPTLAAFPFSSAVSASDGAAFRYLARQVVESESPRCGGAGPPDAFHTLERMRSEVARFRTDVSETPYGPHFAMVEADVLYERSITSDNCIEYDQPITAQQSRAAIAGLMAKVAQLRQISSRR